MAWLLPAFLPSFRHAKGDCIEGTIKVFELSPKDQYKFEEGATGR
jgi:hypothetical protein